jgi:hypothetical protein
MRYEPFRNLFVTPVLPFDDDGEIDEPAYRAFLRGFLTPAAVDAGMALIANPEAGELFTLDRELFDAGCRYVQIDAPEFNEVYADARVRAEYERRGIDPARFKAEGAELLNYVAGVSRPRGTQLGLHVCKGNGTQSWIAEGGYEDICREVFKRADGFDIFHLEFDDERSGSFEPLRHLPDDKVAVLGLVSAKWQALEEPALLRRRVHQAAAFHPRTRRSRYGLAPTSADTSTTRPSGSKKRSPYPPPGLASLPGSRISRTPSAPSRAASSSTAATSRAPKEMMSVREVTAALIRRMNGSGDPMAPRNATFPSSALPGALSCPAPSAVGRTAHNAPA